MTAFRNVGVNLPLVAWGMVSRYPLRIVNAHVPAHVFLCPDAAHHGFCIPAIHVVVQVMGAVEAAASMEFVGRFHAFLKNLHFCECLLLGAKVAA